jgi:hypothetical protein
MKLIEALYSIADPETYRKLSLSLITVLILVGYYGFTILDLRIGEVKDQQAAIQRELRAEVYLVKEHHINRQEWVEIDRRISTYFEQLDRRLDRIENRLDNR